MVSGLYGGRRDECTVKGFTCCTMGFGFYSENVVGGTIMYF